MSIADRFNAMAFKRPVALQPADPRPQVRPEEIEASELESWAQEKDTRVVYAAGRLDRELNGVLDQMVLSIGDPARLCFLVGDMVRIRKERAFIIKTAGLANGSPR